MEIQELWRVVTQRWRIVLTSMLLCVSLALAWSLAGPLSYTAQGRVIISTFGSLGTASDAYSGEQVSEQRAPTYAQLLRGPEIANRAAKRLNGEISPDAIERSIDARIVSRLPMVVVTSTMPSANDAVRVVAAVEQAFQQYVQEIERPGRDGSLTAVRLSGDVPTVVRDGNPLRDCVLAVLAGLLLGTAVAIYRDRTDPVVRSAGQVATVGLGYLGTVDTTADSAALGEVFRRAAVECAAPGREVSVRRILVVGVDQATDTAFVGRGLVHGLAACGRKATLVNAATGEGSEPGLSDVLEGSRQWEECTRATSKNVWEMGAGTKAASLDSVLIAGENADNFPTLEDEDHVVIAGPSIVHSSVAVALTLVADSVICVGRLGMTRVSDVQEARLALEAMKCAAAGLILLKGTASNPDASADQGLRSRSGDEESATASLQVAR